MKNFNLLLFVIVLIIPSIHYGYDRSDVSNSTTKDSAPNYNPEEAVMNTSVFFTYNSGTFLGEDASISNIEIDVCIGITDPDPVNATSVDISISADGDADGDADGSDAIISGSGTVTFPAGSMDEQCITVEVIDDSELEGYETLRLELTNVSGGNTAVIGDSQIGGLLSIFIKDNDNTSVGFSEINETSFSENGGVLTVCMSIDNPSDTESTEVEIQTDGCQGCGEGSAEFGIDYEVSGQSESIVCLLYTSDAAATPYV